ncbi:MAG TPA: bifunctional phosphopantothenoylcysteine decarboxylase/phosphopantothenate--cysteine ligase CoaBC [Terriglobia bacterium]|nr:bifunctional phosphopantothenoylcysteine decarboxylase/phosphopantothenate--cysteine ligase CoaBC [Terriglobia bacterium]
MRVALGVTGGIAAYKAAELLRMLQERGLDVQVVMTAGARNFITPLTFASLSGHKVITDMFGGAGEEPNVESAIEHIAVAQGIDALVIAPATANVMAKIAQGIADDFLTTLCLATRAPIVVAPAMNVNMWENAATQQNLQTLRTRGIQVLEPDEGYLACGMIGSGRLASVESIARAVFETLRLRDDLRNETVLISAGPTEEPLDPVRYITNRSSGKMGYALAEACTRRGAAVTLVSGPTRLPAPAGVSVENVRTTAEMRDAMLRCLARATVVLMAAAVVDFAPARIEPEKIKKRQGALTLELKPTLDILAEISRRRKPDQLVVGFAAETSNLLENAASKLQEKGLDMIVANDVTQPGAGFDADTNIVTLIFPGGQVKPLEKMSKLDAAHAILDEAMALRAKRVAAGKR